MKAYETIRNYRNSNHSRHEAKRRQRKALRTADNRKALQRYWKDLRAHDESLWQEVMEYDMYDDMSL